uniref:Uncharacterized protein n=1 Tax=Anguilla anguilla TaxID=7936 RepID=A0A0E9W1R2_ANGAN
MPQVKNDLFLLEKDVATMPMARTRDCTLRLL